MDFIYVFYDWILKKFVSAMDHGGQEKTNHMKTPWIAQ